MGGNKISPLSIYSDTTELELKDPQREGYDFKGWYYDSSHTSMVNKNDIPSENITIYAKWSIKQITITFYDENSSAFAWEHVDYGSSLSYSDLPNPPAKPGHTAMWQYNTDGVKVTSSELANIKEDFSLKVFYTLNLGSVAYYVSDQDLDPEYSYLEADGATVNGYKIFSYNKGTPEDAIDKPANPYKEGFYFLGWFYDKEHTQKCINLPEAIPYSNSNIVLYAHFVNVSEMYKYMTYDTITVGGESCYRVIGLTPQGKNQDTIVIPDFINGIKVVAIGREYTSGSADNYRVFDGSYLTNITIPNTVTSIGSFAFMGSTRLKAVSIDGNNLVSIGTGAFSGCKGLTEINLPDSVVTIGAYAFAGITKVNSTSAIQVEFGVDAEEWSQLDKWYFTEMSLEKFNITKTSVLSNLRPYAFYNTSCLTSISIPNSLTEVDYTMFDGSFLQDITIYVGNTDLINVDDAIYSLDKTMLFYYPMYGATDFVLHANTTSIAPYAFYNNKTIQRVLFNDSLTTIGAYAFENAKLLESITMNTACALASIGNYAFSGCENLDGVEFSSYLNTIGEGAFKNCKNITNVTFTGNSLNAILKYTFLGCTSLDNVVIPSNVKSIGDYAFYGCLSLKNLNMNNETSIMNTIGSYAFSECINLEPIVLPYNITSIESYAFASIDNYMNLDVDLYKTQLISIGAYAFKNCRGMSTVNLPQTLQSIGEGVFENCTGLFSASFNSTPLLVEIPYKLFYNCTNIRNTIYFPNNVETVGDYAFYNCSSIITIRFNKVKSIGLSAFENCAALREGNSSEDYILPSMLETIGERAFANCSSLVSIHIPNTLTAISSEVFMDCSALTDINYNANYILETIGENSFANCTSLTSFAIPSTLKQRGENSGFIKNPFYGCSALLNFVLYPPNINNLIVIDGIIFEQTSTFETAPLYSLYAYPTGRGQSYDVLTNVSHISDYAFYGSAISALSFTASTPESTRELITLTKIGKYAFADCNNLTSVLISKRIYAIDDYAFYNCKALNSLIIDESYASDGGLTETIGVYYQVTNIGENQNNNNLLNIGEYAFGRIAITSLEIAPRIININEGAFSDCYSLLSINFIDSFDTNLLNIGPYAFYADSGLTSLELPIHLQSIGEYAFSYCVNVRTINFKTSLSANGGEQVVLDIGAYAFQNCHFLYTLNLPSSLNSLGEGVFSYASRLKYVNFAPELNLSRTSLDIPSLAFLGDADIETISIPSYITNIGEKAFYELTLNEISFLTSNLDEDLRFGNYAFANLNELTSIDLPDRLVEIGNHTFENSNISTITYSNGGRSLSIGDYAFNNIKIKEILINGRISSIGTYAFSNTTLLEKASYVDHSDLSIADYTYYGSALKEITFDSIPDTATIGSYAFYGTHNLTIVSLSGNGTTLEATSSITIGSYAFYNSAIGSVSLISNSIEIGDYAFNNTHLKSVNVNAATIEIGNLAIANNLLLSSLIINASGAITKLGIGFASSNPNLQDIDLTDTSSTYDVADGVVYKGNTLLLYPAGKVGATYKYRYIAEYEEYVLTMEDPLDMQEYYDIYYTKEGGTYTRLTAAPSAWAENTYYEKTVRIAPYAFAGNSHIRNLVLESGTTTVDRNALSFVENSPSLTFFTPAELVDEYINDWRITNFAPISENLNGMVLKLLIGDRYSLEKYTGDDVQITINSKILDGEKTYNIVSIADEAFKQNISITSITLGPGIEKVGKYAFANCTNLVEFVVGSMLTTIDIHAFQNCVNLQSVTFNNAIKYINNFAFENCILLDNVVLPDSVQTIGQYAFTNCTSLSSISLGNGLTSILDNSFENCSNLVSISIPASVTEIYGYVFANCNKLSYIYINSKAVPTLKKNGFAQTLEGLRILVPQNLMERFISATNWRDYTNKILPIEYMCQVDGFEDYIIKRISGTNYRLVGYLGNEANVNIASYISNDINITEIGSYALNHFAVTVNVAEGIQVISDYAFYNAKNLTEVTLPSTTQKIGTYAFANLDSLVKLDIVDFVNNQIVVPALTTIGDYAFFNTALTSIVIPEKVASIGNYAFGGDTVAKFENITFNMTDTGAEFLKLKIGNYAFINNVNLTSITFNCFVESIGDGAFNNCTALRNIYFNSVKKNTAGISTQTPTATIFLNCNNLSVFVKELETLNSFKQSWENDNDQSKLILASYIVRDENNSVVYDYDADGKQIVIDTYNYFVLEKVSGSIAYIKNYIGDYTGRYIDAKNPQEGDPLDTDIIIPSTISIEGTSHTITQISAYAFNNKITSVQIPSTVTNISGYAFYNATSLKSVSFSGTSKLATIKSSAFENCTSLAAFHMPKSVTEVGSQAFKNCSSLANMTFEEITEFDVKTKIRFEDNVFENCTKLNTISLPDHAISLGGGIFKNASNLQQVNFNVGTSEMATIKAYAFQNTAIASITFPEKLQGVGDYAFDGCVNLTSVYLTKASGIPTNTENNVFNNITNPFIRVYVPYTSYESYVVLQGWKTRSVLPNLVDDTNTFNYRLTGVVGNETAIITNYLGTSTNLNVPSQLKIGGNYYRVTSINSYAGNTKITKVEFASPSYLSTLASSAFANCTSLREIQLPNTITVIEQNAFYGCVALTDITLPSGISIISNRTFYNCSSLTEITLPSSVIQIGEAAFSMCTNLNRVIVEMSGTTIATLGSGAFTGVSKHFVIVVPTATKPYFLNEWYAYQNVIFARNEMYGDYIIKENIDSVEIIQYNGYTNNLNFDIITIKGKKIISVAENAFVDESLVYILTSGEN